MRPRRCSSRDAATHGLPLRRAGAWIVLFAVLAVATACGGGGRLPPATPRGAPAETAAAPASGSVQALFESGRYREVVDRVGDTADPEAHWFAAQSAIRLGEGEEAARQFARLAAAGGSDAWRLVSDLALAILRNDVEVLDRLRAAPLPADPFVQYELGLAHGRRDDHAAAAQAFDRCAALDPYFAYAYYNAALAYDRLNRPDLAVARLETFRRLAPDAPERAGVDAILRTTSGQ